MQLDLRRFMLGFLLMALDFKKDGPTLQAISGYTFLSAATCNQNLGSLTNQLQSRETETFYTNNATQPEKALQLLKPDKTRKNNEPDKAMK